MRRPIYRAFALFTATLLLHACSDDSPGEPWQVDDEGAAPSGCDESEQLDCVDACGDDSGWWLASCVDGRWDCGVRTPVDDCPPDTDWGPHPDACDEPAPECVDFCGSDVAQEASCVGGQWDCGDGVPIDACPADTCWGPPPPNSACADGRWVCDASQEDFSYGCPETLCLTCEGFDPIADTGACACACDAAEDVVRCEPAAPQSCETTSTSTLDGVTIELAGPCRWSLAQVAAGITIPYVITVGAEAEDVTIDPKPLDAGLCGLPNASGLIPFASIFSPESSGGNEEWCICDVGFCGDNSGSTTLSTGAYEEGIDWDGRNFMGESDTGEVPGDPFPAGSYTVEVRAEGSRDGADFEVVATMAIELVP